jgi:peptidoglycan/LPS O-acetylase OafA/YrhL
MNRRPGLDLMRACAILMILICHSVANFWDSPADLPRVVVMTHRYLAESGTDLFFALSGFLIGGMILRKPPGSFADLRRFYIRRWLRTIPLAWVWMAALVCIVHPTVPQVLEDVFMIRNLEIPMPAVGFFPVMWSLFVEEWFYLLFPIVFIAFRVGDAPIRRLALLLAGACILRGLAAAAGLGWAYTYSWTFLRFDVLIAGVLVAACFKDMSPKLCRRLAIAGTLTIAARWAWTIAPNVDTVPIQLIDQLAGTFGSAAVLGWLYHRRTVPAQRFFFWTATLSYPLYLVNLEIFGRFYEQRPGSLGIIEALVAVALVAYLLHKTVEHPVMAWRDRMFADARRSTQVPAPAAS